VQNSVVTFGQDFVVPQVMESGPITKVCQYNHQKFKRFQVHQVSQDYWRGGPGVVRWNFLFLVCYAARHLVTQLPQRRIQVVRSNKVARKRLTKSNGTPAMDLGPMNID